MLKRYSVELRPDIVCTYEGVPARSEEEAIEKAKKRFNSFYEAYPKIWIDHPGLKVEAVREQDESEHDDQWDLGDWENGDNDDYRSLSEEEISDGLKHGLIHVEDETYGTQCIVDVGKENPLVFDVVLDMSMPEDRMVKVLTQQVESYMYEADEPEAFVAIAKDFIGFRACLAKKKRNPS